MLLVFTSLVLPVRTPGASWWTSQWKVEPHGKSLLGNATWVTFCFLCTWEMKKMKSIKQSCVRQREGRQTGRTWHVLQWFENDCRISISIHVFSRCDPVLLQKTQEDSLCVLTLSCSLGSSNLIGRLLVVSEARTAEVYNQSGDYCGTARGQRDNSVHTDR